MKKHCIGDKIYGLVFGEDNEIYVLPIKIFNISPSWMVQICENGIWMDPGDPSSSIYWTQDEAKMAALRRMIEKDGRED